MSRIRPAAKNLKAQSKHTEREVNMETPYQNKPRVRIQIKPENIKISEAKIFVEDNQGPNIQRSKTAQWPTQFAGDCSLEAPILWIIPEGWFNFSGNLRSSENDDSWGILHFDFKQANGLVLWSSGAFWSPTIGDWAPWTFDSTYPAYLYEHITNVQFWSHC
jgi:hypothetical protein